MREWLIDITAQGLNIEKLIRRAGEASIELRALDRSVRSFCAQTREDDLPALRALCEKGGWKLETGARHGTGRAIEALNRRRILLAACVAGVAALIVGAMLMWRVEVQGAGSYYADLMRFLTEQGYTKITWKSAVDTGGIRDALEWRYPEVAWVEVGWRGTALHITMHKGQPVGETLSYEGCCDVVATRAGIIESVITVAGTPMVKAGDIVRKGDVLIRGEERGKDETLHPVAARGQVLCRVWDGASICVSMMEKETVYTGRLRKKTVVQTPWFPLWPDEQSEFVEQDVSVRRMVLGGLFFPLYIEEATCREAQVSVKKRDLDEAKAEAALGAMRKLREKVGTEDKFIDKWVEYSMIEDEKLQAVAIGERCIDIGERREYAIAQSGMVAPELP